MSISVSIRFAEADDLPAIVGIYNQAVTAGNTTGDLEPVKVQDRERWFNEHSSDKYPVYVAVCDNKIIGWCALSAYRPGRIALSRTAEISYYMDYAYHKKGIASQLIQHAINDCKRIGIENLFAILLDCNYKSVRILEKFHFLKWGHMPHIADLNGIKAGHFIYGLNLDNTTKKMNLL